MKKLIMLLVIGLVISPAAAGAQLNPENIGPKGEINPFNWIGEKIELEHRRAQANIEDACGADTKNKVVGFANELANGIFEAEALGVSEQQLRGAFCNKIETLLKSATTLVSDKCAGSIKDYFDNVFFYEIICTLHKDGAFDTKVEK